MWVSSILHQRNAIEGDLTRTPKDNPKFAPTVHVIQSRKQQVVSQEHREYPAIRSLGTHVVANVGWSKKKKGTSLASHKKCDVHTRRLVIA